MFPQLPKTSLSNEEVVSYLSEWQNIGYQVFEEKNLNNKKSYSVSFTPAHSILVTEGDHENWFLHFGNGGIRVVGDIYSLDALREKFGNVAFQEFRASIDTSPRTLPPSKGKPASNIGPLEFPGENHISEEKNKAQPEPIKKVQIFPATLIKKIPKDIAVLCDEFNFNYQNGKPYAGILLLRRILPLSIVRKFQKLNRENEIKDSSNEFFDTKALLGKVEKVLNNSRVFKELMAYKSLVDSSQHSYSLSIDMTDTEGAAIKIRIFLDAIY